MRRALLPALLTLVLTQGCSNRLAEMQSACGGTWMLVSREMADGSVILPPAISGTMYWHPIDARKAHVSMMVSLDKPDRQIMDHAGSVYEISTSAITRKRHSLIQRGYRGQEGSPFSHYNRAKTAKGKASLENGEVRFYHAAKDLSGQESTEEIGFTQIYKDGRMTAVYTGVFTDTWQRIN